MKLYCKVRLLISLVLLSLILLFCIVVPNRKPVNTLFSFDYCLPSNLTIHKNSKIDIDIDNPRGWLSNSSTNSFRELLVYSNISSVSYAKRMDVLNNSLGLSKSIIENYSVLYIPKKEENYYY